MNAPSDSATIQATPLTLLDKYQNLFAYIEELELPEGHYLALANSIKQIRENVPEKKETDYITLSGRKRFSVNLLALHKSSYKSVEIFLEKISELDEEHAYKAKGQIVYDYQIITEFETDDFVDLFNESILTYQPSGFTIKYNNLVNHIDIYKRIKDKIKHAKKLGLTINTDLNYQFSEVQKEVVDTIAENIEWLTIGN